MLRWTMTFLVIAIIAALLGFTSIAGASITIAKIFFFIFLALFIISIIAGGALFKGAKNLTLKQ